MASNLRQSELLVNKCLNLTAVEQRSLRWDWYRNILPDTAILLAISVSIWFIFRMYERLIYEKKYIHINQVTGEARIAPIADFLLFILALICWILGIFVSQIDGLGLAKITNNIHFPGIISAVFVGVLWGYLSCFTTLLDSGTEVNPTLLTKKIFGGDKIFYFSFPSWIRFHTAHITPLLMPGTPTILLPVMTPTFDIQPLTIAFLGDLLSSNVIAITFCHIAITLPLMVLAIRASYICGSSPHNNYYCNSLPKSIFLFTIHTLSNVLLSCWYISYLTISNNNSDECSTVLRYDKVQNYIDRIKISTYLSLLFASGAMWLYGQLFLNIVKNGNDVEIPPPYIALHIDNWLSNTKKKLNKLYPKAKQLGELYWKKIKQFINEKIIPAGEVCGNIVSPILAVTTVPIAIAYCITGKIGIVDTQVVIYYVLILFSFFTVEGFICKIITGCVILTFIIQTISLLIDSSRRTSLPITLLSVIFSESAAVLQFFRKTTEVQVAIRLGELQNHLDQANDSTNNSHEDSSAEGTHPDTTVTNDDIEPASEHPSFNNNTPSPINQSNHQHSDLFAMLSAISIVGLSTAYHLTDSLWVLGMEMIAYVVLMGFSVFAQQTTTSILVFFCVFLAIAIHLASYKTVVDQKGRTEELSLTFYAAIIHAPLFVVNVMGRSKNIDRLKLALLRPPTQRNGYDQIN